MEGVRGAMAEVGEAVEEAVQGGVREAAKEVLEMGALLRGEMRAAEEAAQRALAAEQDARRASATEALAAVDELRAWTEAEVARQASIVRESEVNEMHLQFSSALFLEKLSNR